MGPSDALWARARWISARWECLSARSCPLCVVHFSSGVDPQVGHRSVVTISNHRGFLMAHHTRKTSCSALFNSDLPDSIRVPVFSVSGWFGSDNPARIICLHSSYLSFLTFIFFTFIFRNARVTGSTAVLGQPHAWAIPCCHPTLATP